MTAPDIFTSLAKELLREKLAQHRDPGVRLLADIAVPDDNDPAVVRVAAALRERAA